MKTGEVISATQIKDEYIENIKEDLDGLNNPALVEKLAQMISHFAYTIDMSDVILTKIIDVKPQEKPLEEPVEEPIEQKETIGTPEMKPVMPEELRPNIEQGVNPTELSLKQEYENKIRELNAQIKQSDTKVKEEQSQDLKMTTTPPPPPTEEETKKHSFFDKLKASK